MNRGNQAQDIWGFQWCWGYVGHDKRNSQKTNLTETTWKIEKKWINFKNILNKNLKSDKN